MASTTTTSKITATSCKYRNSKNSGGTQLYIGSASSSGTGAGTYKFFMTFSKPSLPAGAKILNFSLSIYARKSSSGYNGCVAAVSFVNSTSWSATELWKFTDTFNITESNAWKTFTTANMDSKTFTTFFNSLGDSFNIKLQRVSGMGITGYGSNASSYYPYITLTYYIENQIYVYNSGWKEATPYVRVIPSYSGIYNHMIGLPENNMTSDSSQGYTASASSYYNNNTNYAPYKAFNGSNLSTTYSDAWCANTTDTAPWIQFIWDRPLYNVTVHIENRAVTTAVGAPIAGTIYGLNASGTILSSISYSGRTTTAGEYTTHSFSNNTVAYQGIKIAVSSYDTNTTDYCSIGMITVSGYEYTPNIPIWVEYNPYVYVNNNWVG